jgi:branched-chain amino acid transport system substrate-binding protein
MKLGLRTSVPVLCAAIAALVLAACGSSSKKTTGTAATRASATTAPTQTSPAASGTPYKVGVICSCTGPIAPSLGQQGDVAKAWAASVNASGGLNGHPVSVMVEDDANNASTALLAAKKLIAAKVMAVIDGSAQQPAYAGALAKAGIPVTGGLPFSAAMFTNPDWFPTGAVLPASILGEVAQSKAVGKKHMGVFYCAEAPACALLVSLFKAGAAVVGGVAVSGQGVSMTAPNYTAPCLAMKSQGVDVLNIGVTAPIVLRIADSCAQQGYKPLQANQAPTSASSWTKDANMAGTLLIDAQAPWFATSIPAVAQFTQALDKYAPGMTASPEFGPNDLSQWIGGKLFEAAVKAGNVSPTASPSAVKQGLYKLKNETLGGLTGPLNYTPGKPAFPACYYLVGIQGGKFTTPKGTGVICPPAAQVKELGTILSKAG